MPATVACILKGQFWPLLRHSRRAPSSSAAEELAGAKIDRSSVAGNACFWRLRACRDLALCAAQNTLRNCRACERAVGFAAPVLFPRRFASGGAHPQTRGSWINRCSDFRRLARACGSEGCPLLGGRPVGRPVCLGHRNAHFFAGKVYASFIKRGLYACL